MKAKIRDKDRIQKFRTFPQIYPVRVQPPALAFSLWVKNSRNNAPTMHWKIHRNSDSQKRQKLILLFFDEKEWRYKDG